MEARHACMDTYQGWDIVCKRSIQANVTKSLKKCFQLLQERLAQCLEFETTRQNSTFQMEAPCNCLPLGGKRQKRCYNIEETCAFRCHNTKTSQHPFCKILLSMVAQFVRSDLVSSNSKDQVSWFNDIIQMVRRKTKGPKMTMRPLLSCAEVFVIIRIKCWLRLFNQTQGYLEL